MQSQGPLSVDDAAKRVDAFGELGTLATKLNRYGFRTVAPDVVELRRDPHLLLVASTDAYRSGAIERQLLGSEAATRQRRFILIGKLAPDELPLAQRAGLAFMLASSACEVELQLAIERTFELMEVHQRAASHDERLSRFEYELDELIDIARALTKERDLGKLLGLILEKARFVTGADAGSIYVLEGEDPADQILHFKLTQNDSLTFDSSEFQMPVNRSSMAGWVVVERQSIRIHDVYHLPPESPFGFDRSFDRKTGYRTKSMLCAPLVGGRGDVIGVLQLINKKRRPGQKLMRPQEFEDLVVPFDDRSEQLLVTLAAQAGIALENALLIEEIRGLFEGFVRASVDAIEARDPTTSGHSRRVAQLTVQLARAVNEVSEGPYAGTCLTEDEIRELEYASLLHDFGKIGVREPVLVKAKKLYPHELEAIRLRIELGLREVEVQCYCEQIAVLERGGSKTELERVRSNFDQQRRTLEQAYATVVAAAEPTLLKAEDRSLLDAAERLSLRRADGHFEPLLSPAELTSLRIERGSLTAEEFAEIRGHVVHTQRYLSRIPWGRALRRVPEIAGAHHERLNGTGYPAGLSAAQIPLQSKMMSIADIYDALTAQDRPYKRAVSPERAVSILELEVRDFHLDGELVRIFREARVWTRCTGLS